MMKGVYDEIALLLVLVLLISLISLMSLILLLMTLIKYILVMRIDLDELFLDTEKYLDPDLIEKYFFLTSL